MQERQYAAKDSTNHFHPTSLGVAIVEAWESLGFDFTRPHLRALTEQDMKDVAAGRAHAREVLRRTIAKYRTFLHTAIHREADIITVRRRVCACVPCSAVVTRKGAGVPQVLRRRLAPLGALPSVRCRPIIKRRLFMNSLQLPMHTHIARTHRTQATHTHAHTHSTRRWSCDGMARAVARGDSVVLCINGGAKWLVVRAEPGERAKLGRGRPLDASLLCGRCWGSLLLWGADEDTNGEAGRRGWALQPAPPQLLDGLLHALAPADHAADESGDNDEEDAEEDGFNHTVEAGMAGVSFDQTARCAEARAKAADGLSGLALVRWLATSSATFARKSSHARRKYLRRKVLRHCVVVQVQRPSAPMLASAFLHAKAGRCCMLRRDTLALLLAHAALDPQHLPRVLVLETALGVVLAAVLERLLLFPPSTESARSRYGNRRGQVVRVYAGQQADTPSALPHLVPPAAAGQAQAQAAVEHATSLLHYDDLGARSPAWMARHGGQVQAAVLVHKYSTLDALRAVWPWVAPGGRVVMHALSPQPLAEAHQALFQAGEVGGAPMRVRVLAADPYPVHRRATAGGVDARDADDARRRPPRHAHARRLGLCFLVHKGGRDVVSCLLNTRLWFTRKLHY